MSFEFNNLAFKFKNQIIQKFNQFSFNTLGDAGDGYLMDIYF